MTTDDETSLDPLGYLLFVTADERFVPAELAQRIATLNALLKDMGSSMHEALRTKWLHSMHEVLADCANNVYSLSDELLGLSSTTLKALQARFHEIVEGDYSTAAEGYDEASSTIALTPGEPLKAASFLVFAHFPQEPAASDRSIPWAERHAISDSWELHFNAGIALYTQLPHACLCDCAGDAFCRASKTADAVRCYQQGLDILARRFLVRRFVRVGILHSPLLFV